MRIGDLQLDPVSDGTFIARPKYFGDDLPDGAHPELFHRATVWLGAADQAHPRAALAGTRGGAHARRRRALS
jgi:hypothetical protein